MGHGLVIIYHHCSLLLFINLARLIYQHEIYAFTATRQFAAAREEQQRLTGGIQGVAHPLDERCCASYREVRLRRRAAQEQRALQQKHHSTGQETSAQETTLQKLQLWSERQQGWFFVIYFVFRSNKRLVWTRFTCIFRKMIWKTPTWYFLWRPTPAMPTNTVRVFSKCWTVVPVDLHRLSDQLPTSRTMPTIQPWPIGAFKSDRVM